MKATTSIYHTAETGWKYRTASWSTYLTLRGDRGTIFKGWWGLGKSGYGESLQLEVALGGEDNMIQFGGQLPYLGRAYFGIKVPRKLTNWMLYQRRVWGIKIGYIGNWFDAYFAYDTDADDMASYYQRKRGAGEELIWSRARLWPGVHFKFDPRLRDWMFGRQTRTETLDDVVQTVVPMPEGNYPCEVRLVTETWERKRWPFSRLVQKSAEVTPVTPIPVPGKGENSWDCEDDFISSSFVRDKASVAAAVSSMAESALRSRERYASLNWTPDKGWPEGVEANS